MTTEAKQFKEVTVLLVEDDDVDVMGVERALRKLKILNPIVRAKDGLEALELLRDPHAVSYTHLIRRIPKRNTGQSPTLSRHCPTRRRWVWTWLSRPIATLRSSWPETREHRR